MNEFRCNDSGTGRCRVGLLDDPIRAASSALAWAVCNAHIAHASRLVASISRPASNAVERWGVFLFRASSCEAWQTTGRPSERNTAGRSVACLSAPAAPYRQPCGLVQLAAVDSYKAVQQGRTDGQPIASALLAAIGRAVVCQGGVSQLNVHLAGLVRPGQPTSLEDSSPACRGRVTCSNKKSLAAAVICRLTACKAQVQNGLLT